MFRTLAYHCTNEPHEECKKKIEGDEEAEETSDIRHPAVVSRSCDQVLAENDIWCSRHAMLSNRTPLGIDRAT